MSLAARNLSFMASYQGDSAPLVSPEAFREQLLVPTRKGGMTVVLGKDAVHSKYDPVKEAKKWVGTLEADLHFHFGFGLGYGLDADSCREGGSFLIFEPIDELMQAAFHQLPLAQLLPAKNAFLCNQETAFRALIRRLYRPGSKVKTWVMPFHEAHLKTLVRLWRAWIQDEIFRIEAELLTVKKGTAKFSSAVLKSLPYSACFPGVEELKNRFEGRAAVVVSPGPSLEKTACELAAVRDRVLVIASARSARVLARHGISPDFLVHNEDQPFYRLIEDLPNLGKTAFVLSDKAEPAYFLFPHGATFVFGNPTNPAGAWLAEREPRMKRFDLATAGSVATEAFSLALHLGCEPIVLLGQDLALSGDRYYAAGQGEDRRFLKGERKQKVPGYFGGTVESAGAYILFLKWFEEQARLHNRCFWNATQGGVRIHGFQNTKLTALLADVDPVSLDSLADLSRDNRGPARINLAGLGKTFYQQCLAVIDIEAEALRLAGHVPLGAGMEHPVYRNMLRLHQKLEKLTAPFGVLSGFLQEELHQRKNQEDNHQRELDRILGNFRLMALGAARVKPFMKHIMDLSDSS